MVFTGVCSWEKGVCMMQYIYIMYTVLAGLGSSWILPPDSHLGPQPMGLMMCVTTFSSFMGSADPNCTASSIPTDLSPQPYFFKS